ncbi:Polyadenylate-binding protein-interacting protein 1 [Pseudolycoriella hygida]|uniref:Polyadenylate-binding protein-interacting protein 1 n=1 Tax=Pseudolycoriella hygida TaxID=35572 RepID=A0A9Q0NCR0_9DIPT|nr:Polyadenylate-binding protein-interacting protein 1 [Pseudolycoriella hygida]
MQNCSRPSFNEYSHSELRPPRGGNVPRHNAGHHKLSVDAPEFVPQTKISPIDELNSLYLEFAHSEFVMSNSIEIIFDQSINEQNFRYMGARICRLLDALDASPDSVFRHLLRLKMNYNQEENLTFITNDAHKVRGTTLFLAELYIQLQNDGVRIGDVAKSIYKAINLLLQKTTPENIKCVCQTMKLCGYELEIDFPTEADDVLSILKQVKDIDVSTERLLRSVLELSQNRWGRNEPVLSTPIIEHNMLQNYSNEPVFYGPDGEIITEEESKFLSDIPAYPNFDYCEDSNDPDELAEPEPEMDLEIQMAFKDFVKSQNQK